MSGVVLDPSLPAIIPNSTVNDIAYVSLNSVTIDRGTPEMTTVYSDSTPVSIPLESNFAVEDMGWFDRRRRSEQIRGQVRDLRQEECNL